MAAVPMTITTLLDRTIGYCERAITRPAGIGRLDLEEFYHDAKDLIARPVEDVRTAGDQVLMALTACRNVVNHFGQGEICGRWQAVVGVLLPMVNDARTAEFAKRRGNG